MSVYDEAFDRVTNDGLIFIMKRSIHLFKYSINCIVL